MGNRQVDSTAPKEAAETKLDGIYSLKGTHAADPGHPRANEWAYEGLLEVAYLGESQSHQSTYLCTWSVASDKFQGMGLRSGSEDAQYLTVGWGASTFGIAEYEVKAASEDADGVLSGVRAFQNFNTLVMERAVRTTDEKIQQSLSASQNKAQNEAPST